MGDMAVRGVKCNKYLSIRLRLKPKKCDLGVIRFKQ